MKTKHIAGAGIGLLTLVGQAGAETVGHEKYTYDAAGNIVEKRIDDQVTRFEYEGNLLKSDNQGTHYRHDRADRLTGESREGRVERKLTYQFGDKVTRVEKGGITTELFYNAEGQLVGKNSVGQTEAFAWDGLGLVMRGDRAYANENHLVGGAPTLANGEVTVTDPPGSTLSEGAKSFGSTAYGEGLEEGFFTGKPFVDELDGYMFKYRTYSPNEGRWATPDPIGFPDGKNDFAYLSDPNSGVDPLGTKVEKISNTVNTPSQNASRNLPAPHGTVTWTASGTNPGNNDFGFEATFKHSSSAPSLPSPNTNSVEVEINADDDLEVLFFTAHTNIYQASGPDGSMGLTAKMSTNGRPTISANVTGGMALLPSTLAGVNGVTDVTNAPNISVVHDQEDGWGVAVQFGGANWKWVEN